MIKLTTKQFKELIYAVNYEINESPNGYKTINKELIKELLATAIAWEWNENISEIIIIEKPF